MRFEFTSIEEARQVLHGGLQKWWRLGITMTNLDLIDYHELAIVKCNSEWIGAYERVLKKRR